MPNNVQASIAGLNDLNRKIRLMKQNVDGAPAAKLIRDAARPIQQQAKRNARKGPTGLLQRGIMVFAGKKASKFGALVMVRAKWRGTGAVFEEWGTKERVFDVMRIPLSKLAAVAAKGKARLRGRKSSRFGFVFARKAAAMRGTRFFENAVDQKMPDASKAIEQGLRDLIQESIR